MRLFDLFEAYPTTLTPEMKKQIRAWRKQCRIDNGGGGMCHEVSEIIEQKWGWERMGGTSCHHDGRVICSGHYWNQMPDGTVVDSTADQFGEDDIRVIKPSSPVYKQYRPEWYSDYHPGHSDFPPDDPVHSYTWDGRFDMEAEAEDNLPIGWQHTDIRNLQRLRKYLVQRLKLEGSFYWGDGERTRDQIKRVDDRIAELTRG
jgi:hypothetical protein